MRHAIAFVFALGCAGQTGTTDLDAGDAAGELGRVQGDRQGPEGPEAPEARGEAEDAGAREMGPTDSAPADAGAEAPIPAGDCPGSLIGKACAAGGECHVCRGTSKTDCVCTAAGRWTCSTTGCPTDWDGGRAD